MEEFNEKEYYKKFITEIINNLDNVDILAYLYTFIRLKTKTE